MAERRVSPGVFTNEKDESFIQRGIGEIGAAIVGSTIKGPAGIPTIVNSYSEFEEIFGSYTNESYVPYTAEEYLKNSGVLTVTRLLYEDGYKLTNGAIAVVAKSASVQYVTHLLHPTIPVSTVGSDNVFESSILSDGGSGSFAIKISGSYATDTSIPGYSAYLSTGFISASLINTENNYLSKVFGNSPKSVDYPV